MSSKLGCIICDTELLFHESYHAMGINDVEPLHYIHLG